MTLNRNLISVGDNNTVPNVTWENEFKNRINNILDNVVTKDDLSKYIRGLYLTYVSTTRISISSGVCMDDTSMEMIVLNKDIDVRLGPSGEGGIDNGNINNNTFYYVWLIKHQSSGRVACMLSNSDSNPTMPNGFRYKRLIGSVYVTGSLFRPFTQHGSGNQRDFYYSQFRTVVSGATPANNTWISVDVSTFVPNSEKSRVGLFQITILGNTTATSNGNVSGSMRSGSTVSVTGLLDTAIRTHADIGDASVMGWLNLDSNGNIEYARRNLDAGQGNPTLTIHCYGYRMNL